MNMFPRANDTNPRSNVLGVRGNANMFLDGEPMLGAISGRHKPKLTAMKVHFGEAQFVKQLLDHLHLPIVAPPGLFETYYSPSLTAR
jgi:hypothetical protein